MDPRKRGHFGGTGGLAPQCSLNPKPAKPVEKKFNHGGHGGTRRKGRKVFVIIKADFSRLEPPCPPWFKKAPWLKKLGGSGTLMPVGCVAARSTITIRTSPLRPATTTIPPTRTTTSVFVSCRCPAFGTGVQPGRPERRVVWHGLNAVLAHAAVPLSGRHPALPRGGKRGHMATKRKSRPPPFRPPGK